jgi:hypothetical protein
MVPNLRPRSLFDHLVAEHDALRIIFLWRRQHLETVNPKRFSLVSLELALSPMFVLAIRIERPVDIAVQRPQHPDTRMHHVVARFGGTDQTFDRGLPLLKLPLGLGQACDEAACIRER